MSPGRHGLEAARSRVPFSVLGHESASNTEDARADKSDFRILEGDMASHNLEFPKEQLDIEKLDLKDLGKVDLSLYPSLVFLNVRELGDDVVVKNCDTAYALAD